MIVSLCMIVRDESRCLRRCLDSFAAFVDEINVVDTGSLDETREIARSYTENVVEIPWTGNFSAARNHSLAMAEGDLLLVADADEYLHHLQPEKFRDELSRLTSPEVCGEVLIVSPFERPKGAPGTFDESRVWTPRVFGRDVRYEGAIHEQPVGPKQSFRLGIVFGHDGYTRSSIERKGERNSRILQHRLRSQPDDSYLLYQSGQEHLVRGLTEIATEQLSRAYRLAPEDAPYRLSLILAFSQSLNFTERYPEAAELLAAEIEKHPLSADLAFAIGTTMINWAPECPSDAQTTLIPIAVESFLRCLEIGKQMPDETLIAGTDSWLAAHNLTLLYREALGDHATAAAFAELEASLKPGKD